VTDITALPRPTAAGDARSPWIRGAAWDAFWMQSALWLIPVALLLASGHEDPAESPLDLLVFGLVALFWLGHRFGSAWLAYATSAYRPLLRSDRVRFVFVPLSITAVCFAVMLPADDVLPLSRADRALALATLDFVLVTYHFAAQHYGVLSLYRVRSGRSADMPARRRDRLFALGVGGAIVLVVEAVTDSAAFRDLRVGTWLDREWISASTGTLRVVATALVALLTLAHIVADLRTPKVSLPRVLYVVGVAGMVAGGLLTDHPFLFVAVWTGQHWLAASALATRVARAEPEPPAAPVRRALHAVNRRPWALFAVLALLSVFLLPFFEVEAGRSDSTYYGDRIFGAFAVALRTSSWVPALLALGFATGFLHYWLDRVVYRVSRPAVREAARGLFRD
jgi:hypothetical protein